MFIISAALPSPEVVIRPAPTKPAILMKSRRANSDSAFVFIGEFRPRPICQETHPVSTAPSGANQFCAGKPDGRGAGDQASPKESSVRLLIHRVFVRFKKISLSTTTTDVFFVYEIRHRMVRSKSDRKSVV